MNLNTKGKGRIRAYLHSNANVSSIGDSFFEFSWTKMGVALVLFDDELSKK